MKDRDLMQEILILRSRAGWTQAELARRIGTTQRTVAAWETGASVPRKAMRVRIARAFGLPDESLLSEEAEDAPEREAEGDFFRRLQEMVESEPTLTSEEKANLLDSASRILEK